MVAGLLVAVFTNMLPLTAKANPADEQGFITNQVSENSAVSLIESALAGLNNTGNRSSFTTFADEINAQWGISYLSFEYFWPVVIERPSVVVAVLDTGIDVDHPDLKDKVIQSVNFSKSPTSDDVFGHGTHIAGIIAANLDNTGMAGIAPNSRLLNVKIADDNGICDVNAVAKGIEWAVNNGAQIINLSLQLSNNSLELDKAIEYAKEKGVIVVAAAGNNLYNQISYPAYYDSTISVTALTSDNKLAPLANIADWVDFAMPGYKIYSTLPDGNYGYKTGTSFATAHMSGLVALIIGITTGNEKLDDNLVLNILQELSEEQVYNGFSTRILNTQLIETSLN